MNDQMGGRVDFMCDQTTTALPQLAGGKIKALAVLSDRKLPQLPKVETVASSGYDVNVRSWNALLLPKGTSPAITRRLGEALKAAAADAQLHRQMEAVGVELPAGGTSGPAPVAALIADGLKRDVPALKARGEYLD